MAFSSGTYSLFATGNPVVTGTTVSSTWANNTLDDIATALTTCVLKDGSQTITANIPMSTFKLTGLGAGSALTDSATLRQVQYNFGAFLTSVAGTNTITATATPTPAYTVGQVFTFTPAVTNTGAVTLNISSVGSGAVQLLGGALTGGELQASLPVTVIVTATTPVFEIVQPTQFTDARALVVGATDATKKLRFEVDGFTTATTRVLTPPNQNLTLLAPAGKEIYGLTYDNGTDATNDLNINTGGAVDSTNAYSMTLATALGKQSDVVWAVGGTVGTPVGMLDTGVVGDSDYYLYLIARSDTGVVDAICSLAAPAVGPALPANYGFFRAIGWFKRTGGTIVALKTYETEGGGLELLWSAPTLDVNLASTLTTSRRTDAVKVPLNFSVEAHLNVYMFDATATNDAWVYCPDQADLAPSTSVAPLGNVNGLTTSTTSRQLKVRTSAAGLIAARSTVATVDTYLASTMGFIWARRN